MMRVFHNQEMMTAKDPVLVYKIFRKITDPDGNEHWQTPYMEYPVGKPYDGMVIKPEHNEIDRHVNNLIIGDENDVVGQGLIYAYVSKNHINLDYIGMSDCYVWICEIPTGTKYIISIDGIHIGAEQMNVLFDSPLMHN